MKTLGFVDHTTEIYRNITVYHSIPCDLCLIMIMKAGTHQERNSLGRTAPRQRWRGGWQGVRLCQVVGSVEVLDIRRPEAVADRDLPCIDVQRGDPVPAMRASVGPHLAARLADNARPAQWHYHRL